MTTRTVGPTSTYASIKTAMAASQASDAINLESGYSNETATVTLNNMTLFGEANSNNIVVHLSQGVSTFTLTGEASVNVNDSLGGNGIVGNAGDNRITVTGGVDAVDGGLGIDRLVVDYRLAIGAITGDSTSNFSEAGGGGRSVTVTDGTIEHFTILTGSGADTITTGDGDDIIKTGNGASTISAGQGANHIIGGRNSDTITALDGGNYIDAGDGANNITTGGGDDTLLSGKGADTIVAGGGVDRITLRGGADTVNAGAGIDRLIIDYSAMTTNVTGGVASGNFGSGYVGHFGDVAVSTIDFEGSEQFTITTGDGNDNLTTGDGADVLRSGEGNDVLKGSGGDDELSGGRGNDRLFSGLGADHLAGGKHADVFIFRASEEAGIGKQHDVIEDFVSGVDRINLSAIDANANRNGDQSFDFIGNNDFSSKAGELHLKNGVVSGDVDGDGRADFAIDVADLNRMTQADFQL
jgi:Ca2+-binding RTX toxin-like protein